MFNNTTQNKPITHIDKRDTRQLTFMRFISQKQTIMIDKKSLPY